MAVAEDKAGGFAELILLTVPSCPPYRSRCRLGSAPDGRNGNETINYGYDHLDRLTSASVPSGENYSYDSIGNFSSKGGVTYHYPSGGSQRPHAPDWVANSGNPYGYDANGNLTSADNGDRTYEYDVENHLAFVKAGGTAKHSMVYDGDGVLRKWTNDSNQTMLYVTPDYQLKLVSGVLSDVYVYYRFGGRGVAWHNNTDLRYLLSDHLSSSHAEVGGNQPEMGQLR